MTPQEKNVFGKLSTKTELGSHKVDLGLLQEADQKLKTGNDLYDFSLKSLRELNSGKLNTAISTYTECIKIADSVISKAKELGIDVKDVSETKDIALKYLKECQNIKNKL